MRKKQYIQVSRISCAETGISWIRSALLWPDQAPTIQQCSTLSLSATMPTQNAAKCYRHKNLPKPDGFSNICALSLFFPFIPHWVSYIMSVYKKYSSNIQLFEYHQAYFRIINASRVEEIIFTPSVCALPRSISAFPHFKWALSKICRLAFPHMGRWDMVACASQPW